MHVLGIKFALNEKFWMQKQLVFPNKQYYRRQTLMNEITIIAIYMHYNTELPLLAVT